MKIAGYCVCPNSEDFDKSLIGARRIRLGGKDTVIYCETEDEARELSEKIIGAKFGAYYHLDCWPPFDPNHKGPVNY